MEYEGFDTTPNELVKRPHRNSPAFNAWKVLQENAKIAMEFSLTLEERAVSMRERTYEILSRLPDLDEEKDKLYASKLVEKLGIIAKVENEEYTEKVRVFMRGFTEAEKGKLIELVEMLRPEEKEIIATSFFKPEA